MVIGKDQAPVTAYECLSFLLTYLPINVSRETTSLLEGITTQRTAFQYTCDMGKVRNLKESKLIFLFDVPILTFFFLSHLMFLNLIPLLHIQSIKWRKDWKRYDLFDKQNL